MLFVQQSFSFLTLFQISLSYSLSLPLFCLSNVSIVICHLFISFQVRWHFMYMNIWYAKYAYNIFAYNNRPWLIGALCANPMSKNVSSLVYIIFPEIFCPGDHLFVQAFKTIANSLSRHKLTSLVCVYLLLFTGDLAESSAFDHNWMLKYIVYIAHKSRYAQSHQLVPFQIHTICPVEKWLNKKMKKDLLLLCICTNCILNKNLMWISFSSSLIVCAPSFHSAIAFLKSLFHWLNRSRSRLPLNNALSLSWRVTTTDPARNTHAFNFIYSFSCFVFALEIAVVFRTVCHTKKKQKQSLYPSCHIMNITPSHIRTSWDEPPNTSCKYCIVRYPSFTPYVLLLVHLMDRLKKIVTTTTTTENEQEIEKHCAV